MSETVLGVLAESWGVSEGQLQTAMQLSQSVRERVERLPEDRERIDLYRLHSDVKLCLIGEHP